MIDIKERSYKYALDVISLTDIIPNKESARVIAKQLIRAATSVGANLVEAKSASSTKDFIKFYTYSLKSGNECIFWLSLLKDAKLANSDKIDSLLQETTEIVKIIARIIINLKSK